MSERAALRAVGRGSLTNLAGVVLGGAATLALVLVTARALAPQEAGQVFALTSAFLVLAAVLRLGTPTAVVLFLARLGEPTPLDARRLARLALLPVLGISALVSLAGLATAPWLVELAGLGGEGVGVVLVLLLVLPAASSVETLLAVSRGCHDMRPTVAVERVGRPVLQLVLTLVAALDPTVTSLVAAWCLPYLLALPAAWLLTPVLRAPVEGRIVPVPGEAAEMARFSLSRGLTSILQVAFARVDIVLVAALAGPAQAALYTVATRFVVVAQLVQQAVALAGEPALARALGAGRTREALGVLRTSTVWIVALLWPVLLVVALLPGWWLRLFGEAYADAAGAVVLLALAMLVATGSGVCETVLNMRGRAAVLVGTNAVALVLMIGLDLLLVPSWGVLGAAVGWAVAIATKNLTALVLVVRDLGGTPFTRPWRLVAALNVGLLGCCALLAATGLAPGGDAPWGAVLVALVLLGAAYVTWRRPLGLDLLLAERTPEVVR